MIKTIHMLVDDVKHNMEIEYNKILKAVNICVEKAVQLINEKVTEEKVKF